MCTLRDRGSQRGTNTVTGLYQGYYGYCSLWLLHPTFLRTDTTQVMVETGLFAGPGSPLPDGTVQTSVSSSFGFSPSPGGEARLFPEDQEPDGVRKPAAPGRHSLGYPAGLSAIESPISIESLTPPTDQYAGSIADFIAFNLLYSQQTG